MWLAAVIGVGLLGYLAMELRFLPPIWAEAVLRIRSDQVVVSKGRIPAQLRERIGEILNEENLRRGFIAITSRRRILFSRNVPPSVQQRIRNLLVNPWKD